ncbi:MAG: prephenate dehydratase [Candidatus Thorarchaeota archaeon]|jgi:chorismate mutase/prephenate dehydratase
MSLFEKNVVVPFQGEPGAYSESAVYAFFGPTARPKPCKRFSDVFHEVSTNVSDYGVVPIENSIEGSVTQVFDLFLQHDLSVIGELALKIDHCLIVLPQTKPESVTIVYSHPQALAQCRTFLERSGYEMAPTYDTAGSVKMVKEKRLTGAAAIAGERAAELYGMKVLTKEIADIQNNYTRFFVLSRAESPPSGNDKTSVIFSTKHTPGALYDVLGELATRGINMTKIESRPTRQNPWEYYFYLDFVGHKEDKKCKAALEGMRKRSVFVKVLGSYPRALENVGESST